MSRDLVREKTLRVSCCGFGAAARERKTSQAPTFLLIVTLIDFRHPSSGHHLLVMMMMTLVTLDMILDLCYGIISDR